MNEQDLKELREIFRKEFEENDFCIGEEEVEKVFRKLLNEPEPVHEYPNAPKYSGGITAQQIDEIMKEQFDVKKMVERMFGRDDTFYAQLRKK